MTVGFSGERHGASRCSGERHGASRRSSSVIGPVASAIPLVIGPVASAIPLVIRPVASAIPLTGSLQVLCGLANVQQSSHRGRKIQRVHARITPQRVPHLLQLLDRIQRQIHKDPLLACEFASTTARSTKPFLTHSIAQLFGYRKRMFK